MNRKLPVLTLAFAFAAAAGAGAVEPPPTAAAAPATRPATADTEQARRELADLHVQMNELSRKMAELSLKLGDVGPRAYAFRYLADPDRAMIGVVLAPDPKGVRISALTPDGPAARAGLHTGDFVTAIDGHAIAVEPSKPDAALAEAHRLLADLKDGDSVRLAYRRGDAAPREATVKAARREAWNWQRALLNDPDHPLLPPDFDQRITAEVTRAFGEADRARADVDRHRADIDRARSATDKARAHLLQEGRFMPWWGVNLAELNPGLGRYFGTDRGVLVLSADTAALPGLEAGDVIEKIGGQTVQRPEDALRALRDRPAGSEVTLAVLRQRKPLALRIKAPEYKSIFNVLPPLPPVPPAPPAPPVPPSRAAQ